MGIYDRDYYRREGPRYLEALIPSGRVCVWLIGINIAAFVVQQVTPPIESPRFVHQRHRNEQEFGPRMEPQQAVPVDPMTQTFGKFTGLFILNADRVVHHWELWRLLTYAFLHAGFQHIFFNMLFLWWFGSELERMYGSKEFLAFYLVAAVLGGTAWCAWSLARHDVDVPWMISQSCLGASGAVTGLLILFACHFPSHQVLVFFILPVPIWLFAVFNVGQDTYTLMYNPEAPVAVIVHLAGAGFAALYYWQDWRITNLFEVFRKIQLPRSRPALRLYRPDDGGEKVAVSSGWQGQELDEHLEAKLDAVLAKVASHGKDSLTEAERQVLLKASEIYRRKRT